MEIQLWNALRSLGVTSRPTLKEELWIPIRSWPYEVSTHGQIRRIRGSRPVDTWLDNRGYTHVTLRRGPVKEWVGYLDSVVFTVFNGLPLNGYRPIHVDGTPWNNWAANLAYGTGEPLASMENLVVTWTVMRHGKLQHGSFTDKGAAIAALMEVGDVLIGRNPQRRVVSYEVFWTRNRMVGVLVNPFDKVREFRAQAALHRNQFWSVYMDEATMLLELLATTDFARYNDGIAPPAVQQNGNGEAVSRINPIIDDEEYELPRRKRTRPSLDDAPVPRQRTPL